MKRWRRGAWIAAAVIVGACGARTELPIGSRDAGAPTEDAGPDAPKDARPDAPEDARPDVFTTDCLDAGVTYIYLITQQNELYSFNPADAGFTLRGIIDCPSDGFTPFSMGVNRQGTAYSVFGDGRLYRISTFDASCEPTNYEVGQQGFLAFGMGFATDEGGPEETLYVTEINFDAPSLGLGSINTDTLELSYIGPFSENLGFAAELTGTGDGRLFGFVLDEPGPGGHVIEIDKQTATILSSTPLPTGSAASALAFAFWGGDFYIFTSEGVSTQVTRYRPSDGALDVVATLATTVVGAGVSTCAPQQ